MGLRVKMATDVSDFSAKYSRKAEGNGVASTLIVPGSITLTLHGVRLSEESEPADVTTTFEKVPYDIRYGTNPHQPCGVYKPKGRYTHVGDMIIHQLGKGGFSLTNLQDISQAVNTLKYMTESSCVILKHIVPCGFYAEATEVVTGTPQSLFENAYACDERSAFGGTLVFNREVDAPTAAKIMGVFLENVVATSYTPAAIQILTSTAGTKKMNNGLRVVTIPEMTNLPKFWGDNVLDYLTLRSLPTGELAVEVPYLTGVQSVADIITDPEVDGVCAKNAPTPQQLSDALHAWYVVMNVRSNGVVIFKDGKAIGIGTGQQDRVGAVELAVEKAKRYKHNLEGAVLASDAFFPKPDAIQYAAKAGISAIIWPAGSKSDRAIIEEANRLSLAMMVPKTGERCFLHT